MSAHPQLAASPDDIDYWTHSDWWPVWLVLENEQKDTHFV